MLTRPAGPLAAGDIVTGRPPLRGETAVTVTGRFGSYGSVTGTIRASSAVWVGWADEFNPDLFDPTEALEAFPQ